MTYPCIFVMGATASGKTALALWLVQHLPCDIISVDSALVYRGMNIGTAKPTADILAVAPHRLIDICDPAESYSAAQFSQDARREIAEIQQRGRIPLLVGGTGLYFRALQYGLSELPSSVPEIRQRLLDEIQQNGLAAAHQRLAAIDPVAAQRIHPNDPQRIQRALEVYEISGKTMTEWFQQQVQMDSPLNVIKIIISPQQRETLHARIAQRFYLMLEQGFIEEVRDLQQRGDLTVDLPSMRAVGYRQVWQYLAGEFTEAEMPLKAIYATRQLAKRQLTWLRSETNAGWFESEQPLESLGLQVLTYLKQQGNIR